MNAKPPSDATPATKTAPRRQDQARNGILGDGDTVVLPLGESWRCSVAVCKAAQNLIQHAPDRSPGKITSATGIDGSVTVNGFDDEGSELAWLTGELLDHIGDGAVLVRTNRLVRHFADGLRFYGIPIREHSKPDMPTDWREAKLFIAFLADPRNDYLAYKWLKLSQPGRADEIKMHCLRELKPINSVLKVPLRLPLDAGIESMERAGFSTESVGAARKVAECLPMAGDMSALALGLSSAEFESVDSGEGVLVSTVHSMKGREASVVFLPAFEDQFYPGKMEPEKSGRRVAYVAITRARNSVYLSHSASRKNSWNGKIEDHTPSRFIAELNL